VTTAWTPVLAASVAVIGTLAAAIFTQVWSARREDHRRAEERGEKSLEREREDRIRLHEERRVAYLSYLKALHDASEALRDLAVPGRSEGERRAAANVLRESGLLAAREEVYLVATPDVATVAHAAFHCVASFMDLVLQGEDLNGPARLKNFQDHRKALSDLRAEMRKSLGVPELDGIYKPTAELPFSSR
jgi:hypothetical protein